MPATISTRRAWPEASSDSLAIIAIDLPPEPFSQLTPNIMSDC